MATEIKSLTPTHVWNYFYELTQIPRPTNHTEAVASYIETFGKSLGLETLRDNTGNVLIRKPATSAEMASCKGIILQSHLDMVMLPSTSHNSLTDPIDAYIEDNGEWVAARGTTLGADNGIGIALAMAVLSDKTIEHGPIEALFTIDEEVGMTGAFGLDPSFLKGRILINCDSEEEGQLFAGCAGGADLNISFKFREANVPEGDIAFKVRLNKLSGGHSGVDIHRGRANANKLIARFLKESISESGARLSHIQGGSLRNAIPSEALAVVTIPAANEDLFMEILADYREIFTTEFAGIEQISFNAEPTELPATLIPEEIQDALINALEGCQNGVISMLHDFPDTVESSSNLAVITSSTGQIDIKILVRSSSESRKNWICSSLESVFSLAGAKVEYGNSYNGWQPNTQSPILNLMRNSYEELYGQTPAIKIIHAGLECGIIQGIYPDMDMVSIGVDLQYPHSLSERVNIPSVEKAWNYIKASLRQIKNINNYGKHE